MLKRFLAPLVLCLLLVVLFASALGMGAYLSPRSATASAQSGAAVSGGTRVIAQPSSAQQVNMQTAPKAASNSASKATSGQQLPFGLSALPGVSQTVYAQRKAAAAHSQIAPKAQHSLAAISTQKAQATTPQTPKVTTSFQGMSDSAATCPYFGGCAPPDQALAASYDFVVQAVNTSVAVYSRSGALEPGWPKTAQSFFGIPNPGSCDPNGPFLSDPRAFYDPNTNSLWVAIMQVEGMAGLNPNCPFQSTYWIAVAPNGNANGTWNIYHFDMALGTTNWADFTQFGFDSQAIYFSGNMFNQAETAYEYAEVAGVNKAAMLAGQSVTASYFSHQTLNGTLVDTVQPVLSESLTVGGSLSGTFISSENINFGGGGCSVSACSGVVVWSMTQPGTANAAFTGVFVQTPQYVTAPTADEPGCTGANACIDTGDSRISGTPVWQHGVVSFALDAGVNNGTQVVPGIFWGQVAVTLNDSGTVTGGSLVQSGNFNFAGDQSASYGALEYDADGNLFMVYETMSGTLNPSIAYTSRRVTYTPGLFHDAGTFLVQSAAPYFVPPAGQIDRWGDYEACSPQGAPFTDQVWFAGEYSVNSDWSTYIGTSKFSLGQS